MEIRISDPLDVSEFRVCLASFQNFDYKWSEIHSAARDLVSLLNFNFSSLTAEGQNKLKCLSLEGFQNDLISVVKAGAYPNGAPIWEFSCQLAEQLSQTHVAPQSVTKFPPIIVMSLVIPEAVAKLELLFNILTSGPIRKY